MVDYRHIFIDSAESHVATLGGNFANTGVVEKGLNMITKGIYKL